MAAATGDLNETANSRRTEETTENVTKSFRTGRHINLFRMVFSDELAKNVTN